jgi:hypothetical protein
MRCAFAEKHMKAVRDKDLTAFFVSHMKKALGLWLWARDYDKALSKGCLQQDYERCAYCVSIWEKSPCSMAC